MCETNKTKNEVSGLTPTERTERAVPQVPFSASVIVLSQTKAALTDELNRINVAISQRRLEAHQSGNDWRGEYKALRQVEDAIDDLNRLILNLGGAGMALAESMERRGR